MNEKYDSQIHNSTNSHCGANRNVNDEDSRKSMVSEMLKTIVKKQQQPKFHPIELEWDIEKGQD